MGKLAKKPGLALFFVLSASACGGGGEATTQPEENREPTAVIGEITPGPLLGEATVVISAADPNADPAHQLSKGVLAYESGGFQDSVGFTLAGASDDREVKVEGLPVGDYTVRLRVEDRGGLVAHDQASFVSEAADVQLQARIWRDDRLQPLAGAELCVDDLCATTDGEGRATLTGISTPGPHTFNFPEGTHSSFLVSLPEEGESQDPFFGRNFINYTHLTRADGEEPQDSLLAPGDNVRSLLYMDGGLDMERIVDWYRDDRHTFPYDHYDFVPEGDTITIAMNERDGAIGETVDSEYAERLYSAAEETAGEFLAIVEAIYPDRGFTLVRDTVLITGEPNREEMQGTVLINPIQDEDLEAWGYNPNQVSTSAPEEAIYIGVEVNVDPDHSDGWGEAHAEHWVRYGIWSVLCSKLETAPDETPGLTQALTAPEDLNQPTTPEERAACALLVALDGGIEFDGQQY